MSAMVDDLFAKAAVLSDEERASLAGRLIESLESGPTPPGVEEAWAAEIERRMADYRAGRVQTVGWSELRARLHRER
ncbi:MAG: putative addiction module component [Thermoanaerobaculia bacterium]|jgi:putative addiction module component (TIGR02574 family)|nr:putative addiction module component [Thermoanaerobaculia bacterium]